jgi:hypothetical protein
MLFKFGIIFFIELNKLFQKIDFFLSHGSAGSTNFTPDENPGDILQNHPGPGGSTKSLVY